MREKQGLSTIFTDNIEEIENFFGFDISDRLIVGEVPINASIAWNDYLQETHYSIVFTYGRNNIKQNNKKVGWVVYGS